MRKETGCRSNCRERALLPWLLLGGLLISVFPGPRGKASGAAQEQPALPAAKAAPEVSVPQSPAAAAPSPVFDVAAIHLHIPDPHEHNSIWTSSADARFRTENVSVIDLIHWAYEMPETRILGAPAWAGTTDFNIVAKADPSVAAALHGLPSEAGRREMEKMVQALLADRFKLVAHTETRQLPIYVLVVAKGGARLGPTQVTGTSVSDSNGRIEVQGSNSVAVLAEELSRVAGRDVVDKTGMTGRYHLRLQWTPDDAAAPAPGSGAPADSGPSLFTALEEQLGLKLEPAKGPVEVLVIDHVEMPSAN
jgi:uncharacterized protein (TIGR03435 family)